MKKQILVLLSAISISSLYAANINSSAPEVVITTTPVAQQTAQVMKQPIVVTETAVTKTLDNASKKVKKRKNNSSKKSTVGIDQLNFDFSYSGDIEGAIKQLQEYDYSLALLSPLGKKQTTSVSIDLSNTTLTQVLNAINAQADGYATVQYTPNKNSLRVIYSSKIRDIGYDAMMESKKWRDGNKPKPIITPDGVLEYPYGFYQPVIPCKIGMICDIRLGAGEVLMDWAISDRGNWQMYTKGGAGGGSGDEPSLAFSGAGDKLIPHILIKPTSAASTTNLVVLTNKRTYDILLKATNSDYVLAAGFYFPNMMMQGVEDEKQKLRDQAQNAPSGTPEYSRNFDLSKLNLDDYEITGDDVSWKPTAIFDDGENVWIKFSNTNQVAPALLEIKDDNEDIQQAALLRYFPQPGNMYLVQKLFDKAVLVQGINDNVKKVYITRKKAEKSIWRKIFG